MNEVENTTLPRPRFHVNQRVRKVTGEYKINGEVRAVFTKADGAVRLVVEHTAQGGGSFLHIYSEANLEPSLTVDDLVKGVYCTCYELPYTVGYVDEIGDIVMSTLAGNTIRLNRATAIKLIEEGDLTPRELP